MCVVAEVSINPKIKPRDKNDVEMELKFGEVADAGV